MVELRSGTATILFTDIVGSTELRGRLGDDRADELRRSHDDAWQHAVTAHDGEVVKGLGDGLMAVFAGAGDAVAAAVEGQQRVDVAGRARDPQEALAVRVGISAGDVAWEDGDCHGTPVVIAARLCDHAEGGQILCDDLVRGLARSRTEHDLVLVGERELKGLDEAVTAYEVRWAPEAAVGPAPLPGPLAPTSAEFPFAGRDEERAALADAWKAARSGERTIVLISGEPGQGKTRLTAEAARAAHAEGGWVLAGRCDESVAAPCAPWLEILRDLVAHADHAVLESHVERTNGDLRRLVPELGRRVGSDDPLPALDPETERLAIYEALVDLLTAAAEAAPLFVVIEDAHWADQASIALLRRVVSHLPAAAAVAVLVTYRDTDIDRVHPLSAAIGDLRRAPAVERIALRGMRTDDVERLLTAAGGHELDETGRAFAATLTAETEGNPFFAFEVLRHLAETGVLVQEGGRWQGTVDIEEAGLPEGVREVVGQRLTRLSTAANQTLRTAAVVGREFDLAVVAGASDQGEGEVLDHAEEALEASLLSEVAGSIGRMTFSHALIRSTLLEELSTTRRVRLHARVGGLLEGRPETTAAELAHHFGEAASAGFTDQAVHYAVAAAEEAESRAAHAEAAVFFDQAVEALEGSDDARRAELLLRKCRAAEYAGDVETSRRIALDVGTMAREAGDAELLVRAGCRYHGEYAMFSEPGDPLALEMIREGLEGLDPDDLDLQVEGLAELAAASAFEPGAGGAESTLPDEALALARRADHPTMLRRAIETKLWSIQYSGRPDECLALAEEAVRLSATLEPRQLWESGAYLMLARAYAERGDMDRARRAVERTSTLQTPAQGWSEAVFDTAEAVAAGRWDDARRMGDVALERGRAVMGATAESVWAGERTQIAMVLGHFDGAETAKDAQRETGFPAGYADAAIAMSRGDRAAALRHAHRYLDDAAVLPHFLVQFSFGNLAGIAARTGDRVLVDWLQPQVAPLAGSFLASEVSIRGAAEHAIGLVEAGAGRHDRAVPLLEGALGAARERGWHARVAEHLVDLARAVQGRDGPGDADRARDLATEAIAAADRLDMVVARREAAELLEVQSP